MNRVLDYLVRISQIKKDELVRKMYKDLCTVQIKLSGSDAVQTVKLKSSSQHNEFVIKYKGPNFVKDQLLTFKIVSDDRMFFFKLEGIPGSKVIQITKTVDFYELIRRKEPRFKMPIEWQQVAFAISSPVKLVKSKAKIIEISYSGLRLNIIPETHKFELGEYIKLEFKVHKRAQVSTMAEIKHVTKNRQGEYIVGVEFKDISMLASSKIQSICDEIVFLNAHNSNKI